MRAVTIGERIEIRRVELGIPSQSALARKAGIRQSTLNGLIRNSYRWSPYLVQIARALETTVEYLTGETDDPNAGTPPVPLRSDSIHVVMRVELPSQRALTAMFLGLLDQVDPSLSKDEQAQLLAELLPIGLSQLSDVLPDHLQPRQRLAVAATAVAPSKLDHEPQH